MAEDDMMSAVQKQLAPSVARRVAALFSNRRAYSFLISSMTLLFKRIRNDGMHRIAKPELQGCLRPSWDSAAANNVLSPRQSPLTTWAYTTPPQPSKHRATATPLP
ncbi:hypothetical protein L1887_55572 [Cichorium endivia]|nr:hypothetical protein L1887_55572 [Cichorium endivia]